MNWSPRPSGPSQTDLLERLVGELEAKLAERDAAIVERDAAIAELEAQLEQRDVAVEAMQQRIRQFEGPAEMVAGTSRLESAIARRTPVPLPGRPGRRRAYWLPPVLLFVAILFLVLSETGVLRPIESALEVVVAPLRRQSAALVEGVGDLFQTVREAREWRTVAEDLQERADALSIENVRLREVEAEAVQLRALLNFSVENPTWALLGADVVGWSACASAPCGEVLGQEPNPFLRYLSINVGAEDGVGVGMPVVTGGAVLVGRIAEVGTGTSKVQLLNDPGSGVAAQLQQSRATGLVSGQPDGSLRMLFISQEDEVQEGDIVLTSGLGGVLPRGLVIGQVGEVQQQDYALFQEAVVRPPADYRRVEMMLVIVSFQPLVDEGAESGDEP